MLAEDLTDAFYRWEIRGRGWQVWPRAVALEPPFRPFAGYYIPAVRSGPIDDGRKPTKLGGFLERFFGKAQPSAPKAVDQGNDDEPEAPESRSGDIATLRVSLPPETSIGREAAERFLIGLPLSDTPVSFEVIGTVDSVRVQFTCDVADERRLYHHVDAYFPDAAVTGGGDPLVENDHRDTEKIAVDFGLAEEFMRPLAKATNFAVDPLIAVVAALGDLEAGELALLQVLFQPTRAPWAASALRAVTASDGGSFFTDAPEMPKLAREKLGSPLFATVVRVAARSPSRERTWSIAKSLGTALAQLASPASNELIPLENDDYEDRDHWDDVIRRQSRRSGMLLSADELVALVHLPSASVRSDRLARETQATRALPSAAHGHDLILGENFHRGVTTPVSLDPAHRIRHTHIVGASGTGKSTLLVSMILQDIAQGQGLAVLDPHGDLIDEVLGRMPAERLGDVIVLDPADTNCPVGFNVLQARSEIEKNLLASDLVATFRRFATSWGDQMTAVLGNAVLAFLESSEGGTLLELRRFLNDAEFRSAFLRMVGDPEVVAYFTREFPKLKGQPQASILTRLDAFLRPKLVRNVVAQRESRLDLRRVMDDGKILLAKLAQGAIGEENAHLLGTLLVSKFHQLALSRQEIRTTDRRPFYLYVDEFQHFVTPSLATLLSGGRKFGLGLVLAHQEMRQLQERSPEVASAVLTNPATRICFRLGDADAQKLADGFASFAPRDLQSLGVGEAIARIERADWDFTLQTQAIAEVDASEAEARRGEVIARSRAAFGMPLEATAATTSRPADRQTEKAFDSSSRKVPAPVREPAPTAAVPAGSRTSYRPKVPVTALPPLGRGGPEHKYLQHLVKRLAEDRGWKATVEAPVLGGTGSVDVALEREGHRIACEISVSTDVEHEVGNVQKCLAAGHAELIVIASDKRLVAKLEKALAADLTAESHTRVRVLQPEDLVNYLDELGAPKLVEQTVRGYRVKVSYAGKRDDDARRQAISRVLIRGNKRLRRPETK